MKKTYTVTIDEDILNKFQMAITLSNDTASDVISRYMRQYISDSFASVSKEYASENPAVTVPSSDDSWYGKAAQRIPLWAYKPSQYNHKIIRAFFAAENLYGDVTLRDLEQLCSNPEQPDLYVPTFRSNYAQMKLDGPKTHGKVFEDDGFHVFIWEEIAEILREYQPVFCRDLAATPTDPQISEEPMDVDVQTLWMQIVNEFTANPRDVRTRPTGNRPSLWFYVFGDGTKVSISGGRFHQNRSRIHSPRALNPDEISTIFAIYQRRKQGESVSAEASLATQNQVYWYGIFAELGY